MQCQVFKKFLIIFIFVVNLAGNLSYGNLASPAEIERFLQQQTTIQIFADNSGGFGNLAAADNVMLRLSQLGFNGTFEVIYPISIKSNLSQLFNLPSDFSDDYKDTTRHVRFIALESYMDHNNHMNEPEKLELGFSANGAPTPCDKATSLSDYAATCDFKFLAYIDNWINNSDPENSSADVIQIDQKKLTGYSLSLSNGTIPSLLVSPYPLFSLTENYLLNNPAGQSILEKNPALPTFINKMKDQSAFILPAYGFTLKEINNLLQIIVGARYAQLHSDAIQAKPLIIAVFYDLTNESSELDKVFHTHIANDSIPITAMNAIKELGLDSPGIVTFATISDPDTVNTINHLQPNTLLILSMGLNTGLPVKNIPKIIFDGLYTYQNENILPPINEGMSSLSQLLLSGRPFFTCSNRQIGDPNTNPRWDIGYDEITDPLLKKDLMNFYEDSADHKKFTGFCAKRDTWDNDAKREGGPIYKTLGNFIIQSQSSNTAFSHYFQDIKTKLLDYHYDPVYMSLSTILNIKKDDTAELKVVFESQPAS